MCQLSPQAAVIPSFLFPSFLFLSSILSFLFLRCGIRQPIGKRKFKKLSALSSRFLLPGDAPTCPGIVLQQKASVANCIVVLFRSSWLGSLVQSPFFFSSFPRRANQNKTQATLACPAILRAWCDLRQSWVRCSLSLRFSLSLFPHEQALLVPFLHPRHHFQR